MLAHRQRRATRTHRDSQLVYEYSGNGAFTIASSSSGRRYRFEHPGARIEVDPRDRALMATLPHVRRIT